MKEATAGLKGSSGLEEDFTGKNPKGFVMISYYNSNMRKYKYFINYSMLCKYNFHHMIWKVQRKFEWSEKSEQQMMLHKRLEGRCCQNIQMFSHFQRERKTRLWPNIFIQNIFVWKKKQEPVLLSKCHKMLYLWLDLLCVISSLQDMYVVYLFQ